MKLAIFCVLAFSLALTNAASVDPFGLNTRTLQEYSESLNQRADQITKEVETKYDELVVQPIERVEGSVAAIEERKEENEQCVNQQQEQIEAIVKTFENNLDSCTQTVSSESSAVCIEITKLSIGVAWDTFNLAKGVQKCRTYTWTPRRNACFATQVVKLERLIVKTKRAAESINQSVDETLPQIFHDFESCSAAAEEAATAQLEAINGEIDNCVALL